MVDIEPPVDITPVGVAVDLSGLELGKKYIVVMAVDEKGNQTLSTVEDVTPLPQPTGDLVVFRHLATGRAYLAQMIAGEWTISFSVYGAWADVLKAFPKEDWTFVEVVV